MAVRGHSASVLRGPVCLPSLQSPDLDASHKWDRTPRGLLRLAAFAQRDVFKLRPCRSGRRPSVAFSWLNRVPPYGAVTFLFIRSWLDPLVPFR